MIRRTNRKHNNEIIDFLLNDLLTEAERNKTFVIYCYIL